VSLTPHQKGMSRKVRIVSTKKSGIKQVSNNIDKTSNLSQKISGKDNVPEDTKEDNVPEDTKEDNILEDTKEDNISDAIPNIDNLFLIKEGNTDFYQIGHSKDPLVRMKTLSIDNTNKLNLIACCPGDSQIERDFHIKYTNRWFEPNQFKFNNLEVLILIGEYATLRLKYRESQKKIPFLPENFFAVEDSPVTFNNKRETLNRVRDEIYDSMRTVSIINENMSVPDWYSIPVIEKVHKVGGKYIKAIQSVISKYYTVTKNKEDFVSFHDFDMLLSTTLRNKSINRLPEIIDMVIARLNKYSTPGYIDYKYNIRVFDRRGIFYNIAFLKLKDNLTKDFEINIDYENALINFYNCYNISVSDNGITKDTTREINLERVKEVVEYIQSNPIFVRIDKEEFGNGSYGFKHDIEGELPSRYCSNGVVILACFLLGCQLYDIGESNSLNCSIAICIDPVKDRRFRNASDTQLSNEMLARWRANKHI
jgi:hypothetical protein